MSSTESEQWRIAKEAKAIRKAAEEEKLRAEREEAELSQIEENGKVILHKSFFNQKKEPYAKLNDIRQEDTSSEGGTSSISHAAETAPAISLQSRGDVMLNDDNSSISKTKETANSINSKEFVEKNNIPSIGKNEICYTSSKKQKTEHITWWRFIRTKKET